MKMKVFKSGRVLFRENEFPKFAFLICLGNVNIYKFKTAGLGDKEEKKERFDNMNKLINEYVKREY
jgi:hypothetical protein